MKSDIPLACNMDVFTPSQREAHIQNTIELIQAMQNVQEVDNGYEFTFPNESVIISKIADFISNERLCCPFLKFTLNIVPNNERCPFLKFTLNIVPNNEPVSLSLTGPTGTQEFLRAEFEGAF
jgi:hypothetical protein